MKRYDKRGHRPQRLSWQGKKDSSMADFHHREELGRNHKVMNELHGKPYVHWRKMFTLPGLGPGG